MLVPRFYEDLNVMHDKTMPARTYYIPASVRMNDLVEHRERSDRFQLLNGEWKFQYYNSIYDVTESFYEKGYDVSGFNTVSSNTPLSAVSPLATTAPYLSSIVTFVSTGSAKCISNFTTTLSFSTSVVM
jgi:hypothetical protein